MNKLYKLNSELNLLLNKKNDYVRKRTDLWVLNEDYSREIDNLKMITESDEKNMYSFSKYSFILPLIYNILVLNAITNPSVSINIPFILLVSLVPSAILAYIPTKIRRNNMINSNINSVSSVNDMNNRIKELKALIKQNESKVKEYDRLIKETNKLIESKKQQIASSATLEQRIENDNAMELKYRY